MNKPELYNSNEIDEILDSISLEESDRIEKRMLLALKIEKAMNSLGLKKIDFAAKMKKSPSEITKWLSGTHNFTADTLFDIQRILKTDLINTYDGPNEQISFRKNIIVSIKAEPLTETYPANFYFNSLFINNPPFYYQS